MEGHICLCCLCNMILVVVLCSIYLHSGIDIINRQKHRQWSVDALGYPMQTKELILPLAYQLQLGAPCLITWMLGTLEAWLVFAWQTYMNVLPVTVMKRSILEFTCCPIITLPSTVGTRCGIIASRTFGMLPHICHKALEHLPICTVWLTAGKRVEWQHHWPCTVKYFSQLFQFQAQFSQLQHMPNLTQSVACAACCYS